MTIIKITPEWNGSHNSIENVDNILPGWAEIPENCIDIWKASGPFVNVTVDGDGKITTLTAGMDLGAPTEAELLEMAIAAALEHISGKCSAAIYSGVDVNGKHYSFTQTAQGNIKGMLIEAQNGKTVFLYCADNEPLTTYTADEIKAIAQVMGEWISVNTVYYEQLKTWVNRETDEVVLSTIHYGSQLPNDLTQELTTKLASVGVDITKYASMLGVDK